MPAEFHGIPSIERMDFNGKQWKIDDTWLLLAISKTPKNPKGFHERKLVKNWQVYGMLF
jgi:hypothetical protein